MKGWVVITVLSIWAIFQPSAQAAADFTLDLKTPTKDKYATFLKNIRDKGKSANGLTYGGPAPYGIPVMGGKSVKGFFRVDFTATAGTVAIAIKKSDLYLVAYLFKNDKQKSQANFFKGQITSSEIDSVFPEAKGSANQKAIGYAENYKAIEGKAGKPRANLGLGIKKLDDIITKINGKAFNVQNEAQMLLFAIQMVSEAARFSFIENQIKGRADFPSGFSPLDSKIIILQENWEKISKAIKDNSDKGVFKTEMTFTSASSGSWSVKTVSDLGAALLANLETKAGFDDDDDAASAVDLANVENKDDQFDAPQFMLSSADA